jgi:hypothetical protein
MRSLICWANTAACATATGVDNHAGRERPFAMPPSRRRAAAQEAWRDRDPPADESVPSATAADAHTPQDPRNQRPSFSPFKYRAALPRPHFATLARNLHLLATMAHRRLYESRVNFRLWREGKGKMDLDWVIAAIILLGVAAIGGIAYLYLGEMRSLRDRNWRG